MDTKKTSYSAVLGQVLSNLRKIKGLEQGEVADKMGLTQASYSRLESGKATFSIDQMYQASAALDLSGYELIGELEKYIKHLESDGVDVEPQVRSNSKLASTAPKSNNQVGSFVAGAALGALLIAALSKK
ncbi:helix-turn-helix transcriptional regulator [Vibrio fluvialis]|nr:helix-turn-helix transcriptional regulator [Vibrio fluvialis]